MAEQKVNELSTATPALTDYIMGMSGTAEYKALVSAVAKKIVEDYAGSTLAGSAQSVKSALDALNSTLVIGQGDYTVANGSYIIIPYPTGFSATTCLGMANVVYRTGTPLNIIWTVQMANVGFIVYLRTGTGATIAADTVVTVHWLFKKIA